MYKKEDFVQVAPPDFDAMKKLLEKARGYYGYSTFAYQTGINMSTLNDIQRKKLVIPLKYKTVEALALNSRGEVSLEAFCAANGFIRKEYLENMMEHFLKDETGEVDFIENPDMNREENVKLEKIAFLSLYFPKTTVEKIRKNLDSLYNNPVFNMIVDDYVETYKQEKNRRPKEIKRLKMRTKAKKIADMVEFILKDY